MLVASEGNAAVEDVPPPDVRTCFLMVTRLIVGVVVGSGVGEAVGVAVGTGLGVGVGVAGGPLETHEYRSFVGDPAP